MTDVEGKQVDSKPYDPPVKYTTDINTQGKLSVHSGGDSKIKHFHVTEKIKKLHIAQKIHILDYRYNSVANTKYERGNIDKL